MKINDLANKLEACACEKQGSDFNSESVIQLCRDHGFAYLVPHKRASRQQRPDVWPATPWAARTAQGL